VNGGGSKFFSQHLQKTAENKSIGGTMFWKKKDPMLVVALCRLDAEIQADLQIPIETHEDFELALRIVEFARRKSLPIKTWRVQFSRDTDPTSKLRWLLDISKHGLEVELFCPNPTRIERILVRHRSTIQVFPIPS